MNNAKDAAASRSEEIAFRVLEQVLDVRIELADAGSGDGTPDGRWTTASSGTAIVEVTSPPSSEVMRDFAKAERAGKQFEESGSAPAHLGDLAEHLTDLVTNTLAKDVEKLRRADAAERHLFLHGLTVPDREYFARLSDTYDDGEIEAVPNLILPADITDVWFVGRAERLGELLEGFRINVARYNRDDGWSRHQTSIDERILPRPKIVQDPAPDGWRSPKRR